MYKNETGGSYAGWYYVTGVIYNDPDSTYGGCTLTDGTNAISVYGLKDSTGATRYDAMSIKPVKGDTVKLYGQVGSHYKNVQMHNSNVIEHTAHTAEHTYQDGKCTQCFAKEPVAGELLESLNIYGSTGTLASDSSKITWTGTHVEFINTKGGTPIRTSDTNHYRLYAGGNIIVNGLNGATISKVVINCQNTDYANAWSTATVTNGTVSVSGTTVTITLTSPTSSITVAYPASSQSRLTGVEITYAE